MAALFLEIQTAQLNPHWWALLGFLSKTLPAKGARGKGKAVLKENFLDDCHPEQSSNQLEKLVLPPQQQGKRGTRQTQHFEGIRQEADTSPPTPGSCAAPGLASLCMLKDSGLSWRDVAWGRARCFYLFWHSLTPCYWQDLLPKPASLLIMLFIHAYLWPSLPFYFDILWA